MMQVQPGLWRVFFFKVFFLFFSLRHPEATFLVICCILELKSLFCMHFGARISHLRPTWLLAFGFTWLHLASLGFTWLHLASLGFTWLHLASLGFTWLHLAYGTWLMAFGSVSLRFNFGRSLQLALGVCWVLGL